MSFQIERRKYLCTLIKQNLASLPVFLFSARAMLRNPSLSKSYTSETSLGVVSRLISNGTA